MDIPERIVVAAARLKEGRRSNRITVRDFLRHFGAERRGSAKVQGIRAILNSLELETEPDFETAWIDGPIWLRLKQGVEAKPEQGQAFEPLPTGFEEEPIVLEGSPSAVEDAEEQAASAPTSLEPEAQSEIGNAVVVKIEDPTFRIGLLPAANKRLVVVNQNDLVSTAVTLLLKNKFSQLPVMQGEREVSGVVTWKSIGSRLALECKCLTVADCKEDARVVDSNRTLFDAIPTIVEYGYVLVRDQRDRKITGIVTASDLSLQFQALSEPFLLLREIELHVRQILVERVTDEDFDLLEAGSPSARKPKDIADLTFGQYVRLIQHPQVWSKLNLKIDAQVLTKLLEEVRIIRNDVMHFDPDPMTGDELGTLKRTVEFMQELYQLYR